MEAAAGAHHADPPHHEQEKAALDKDQASGVAVDTESLSSDIVKRAHSEGLRPSLLAKLDVLNHAYSQIGMGRYQWELFISVLTLVGGFGWFADNIWLQGIAIIMPAVANEWRGYPDVRLATLALYVGLIIGSIFWGSSCDIIGRRLAWNSTLLVSGIFGVAAGGANNFVTFCALIAMTGFGVGGNMPVDGTLFLEFLPGNKQYLLTLLSVWWAIGQVVASLIAWGFLARWGCDTPPAGTFCKREDNMGWRYTYFTLGAMMIVLWGLRFFVLPVYESPKFLASVGRDADAVDVIHKIARRNGVQVDLAVEDLSRAAEPFLDDEERDKIARGGTIATSTGASSWELFKHSFENLSWSHVSALFATRRLAVSTILITFCYGSLGLAYPLYNGFLGTYLAQKNASIGNMNLSDTYASYTYQAACGVPGSIVAAIMVDWGRTGRKYAMAIFTLLAGVFLFALTAAKTQVQVNALTSIAAFFENAFYGVLYGYAPELFPTPSRGTGDAICAAASRITGLFAPIIAVYSQAAKTPNGPVYASAAIFVATAVVMAFLPVETRGRTAL